MGWHFPLAILGAWGLCVLVARMKRGRAFLLALVTALCTLTPIVRIWETAREMRNVDRRVDGRNYLTKPEVQVIDWITAHTPAGAAVQPLPYMKIAPSGYVEADASFAAWIPALTGRRVHFGHAGETPNYLKLYTPWVYFLDRRPAMNEQQARRWVLDSKLDYLVLPGFVPRNKREEKVINALRPDRIPDYLVQVFETPARKLVVLKVDRDRLRALDAEH